MKRYIASLVLFLSMVPLYPMEPASGFENQSSPGGILSALPNELQSNILKWLDMKSLLAYTTASATLHHKWMQDAPLLKMVLKRYLRKNNKTVAGMYGGWDPIAGRDLGDPTRLIHTIISPFLPETMKQNKSHGFFNRYFKIAVNFQEHKNSGQVIRIVRLKEENHQCNNEEIFQRDATFDKYAQTQDIRVSL